jgi:hypothetical protein
MDWNPPACQSAQTISAKCWDGLRLAGSWSSQPVPIPGSISKKNEYTKQTTLLFFLLSFWSSESECCLLRVREGTKTVGVSDKTQFLPCATFRWYESMTESSGSSKGRFSGSIKMEFLSTFTNTKKSQKSSSSFLKTNFSNYTPTWLVKVSKAVPPHAMDAYGGRGVQGCIAPRSWPRR